MSFSRKDYFHMLLVLILWAGNIIAIKIAVQEVPPLTAALLRFTAAGLAFLPFIQKTERATLWTILQISVFMNVLHIGTLFIGLKMLDAASVSLLLQMQVVFSTILGAIFFGEKIGWRTWIGMGLAAVGVIVMLGKPDLAGNPEGVGVMMFSTLVLSYSYVKMKHLKSVHPASYVSLMSLFAVPFTLAASVIFEPGAIAALPDDDWFVFGPVLAYQAVLVSFTHILWQRLMHKGDVGKNSAFTLLIPFMAILMSVFFLGEQIDAPMVAGGLTTMLGVGIITLRRIQKGIA